MGAGVSKNISNSGLADKIDSIASKYILAQNYNDMEKISEKDHCDKLVILTAKIIKQQLNPLEQKEMVSRIQGQKELDTVGNTKDAKELDTKASTVGNAEQKGGLENCDIIAKFYVKIAHLYAAIMKTINPVIISTDENGKNIKYDLSTRKGMPSDTDIKNIQHNNFCTNRINILLQESDYNATDPKNKLLTIKPRFCNMNKDAATKKTRKFYEGDKSKKSDIADKRDFMSGGISSPKDKNKKKNSDNDDDDEEDEDEDEKDKKDKKKEKEKEKEKDKKKKRKSSDDEDEEEEEEEGEEEEGKKGKKKGKEEENGDKEKEKKEEEKPIKETPLIMDNAEVGIPELMKLYYDVYDEKLKDFTKMSPEMIKQYQADVETFYKTFTGKEITTDENGNKNITKFEQIPLREFHNSDGCKPEGIYTKPYEGSLNREFGKENLFEKYANHVNKMMNTMNTNQDSLLGILKQIFVFKTPEKKEEVKEEDNKKKEAELKKEEEEDNKKKEDERNKEKKETEQNIKAETDKKELAGPDIIQGFGQAPGPGPGPGANAANAPAANAPGANANAPAANAPAANAANANANAANANANAPAAPAPVNKPVDAAAIDKPIEDANKPLADDAAANIGLNKTQAAGGSKEDEIEEATINPNLDQDLLDRLINSARKLIVNLYITCENDFMEGIHIFEAIVAVQLGKTTNSQINILNNLYLEYLAEHTEEPKA
jgi:flagellar biosynthesis GTPase FlhF